MKAIVYNDYGSPDVLELADIEKPIAGDDEVLVRVRASSVNPLDWHYMRGTPYPLRMGNGAGVKRLGHDFAGQVEATGRNVTRLQPGDICLTSLKSEDLEVLRELIEGRKLTPVIDRSYSLSQTPEAVGYLEEGHARGKVVISLEG